MADNVASQIIGELGEIGKKVGGEVARVPIDITGKALESLGAKSGKGVQGKTANLPNEPTALDQIDREQDRKIKRSFARKALQDWAGGGARAKKQSIWEQLQQEQEQKKQEAFFQAQAARTSQLPQASAKRPIGDLYGTKAKKLGSEVGKNVRQD
jgi:hypothetical protein